MSDVTRTDPLPGGPLARLLGALPGPSSLEVWGDTLPVRAELFGVERLEQHARTLAAAQPVTAAGQTLRVPSLRRRLNANAAVLLRAYRETALEVEAGRAVVPAAEWLLDNYHLVEGQIREIHGDLPPGYYRQLPKLAAGPFAGYPRVFGLAWSYVAHTDSYFDPEVLRRYLLAYQQVQPLTIGELWAVAITLRIVLIENFRRLADQMSRGRSVRAEADALAEAVVAGTEAPALLDARFAAFAGSPLREPFAAQLAKRLRDRDPRTTPSLDWLEDRLAAQSSSVEEVVRRVQERQVASNVTVRNVITSMRAISETDWADLFESASPVDAVLRSDDGFARMDFPSRNLYRSAVEQLARNSDLTEIEVADAALGRARSVPGGAETDPGWHLIGGGRGAFETAIGFRTPARLRLGRLGVRLGIAGYASAIAVVAVLLVAAALWLVWMPNAAAGAAAGWLVLWSLAMVLPATDAATAIVGRYVTWSVRPSILPGLELKDGVPAAMRTLVVVPTLLSTAADLREEVDRLEVHFLSGSDGDVSFALLTDGLDAATEVVASDAPLLDLAASLVADLNARHGPGPAGPRFLHLHRRRLWNEAEGVWMGWERKRGKLHELNRLLRGDQGTSYVEAGYIQAGYIQVGGAAPWVPEGVEYVITLDADTRLPRDAAPRLVGKMAHPLNRPVFDASLGRVIGGHAILQPRVTPSLPIGRPGSPYQRLVSGPGGVDPYAAAVSDVYQDLFGEGSFTGKGIYHVDAFEASLAGRVPENTLLSHDLFEGVFARAGLVSDIELMEAFPARYDVDARRHDRWTRGDWQLLPWILGGRGVTPVGRFKMLDNLRRSLVGPATLAALGVGWLLPWPASAAATAVLLALLALPLVLPILFGLVPPRASGPWRIRLAAHARNLGRDVATACANLGLTLALLPDQARRMIDAIVRTLVRLKARRRLLEWTTAAQAAQRPLDGVMGIAGRMAGSLALGLAVPLAAVALRPGSAPIAVPFALLWLAAPALVRWVSRPPATTPRDALSEPEADDLRLIARRTWRFFEAFVTDADNQLPPDNFQEEPRPVVAHRTSPTNIGLYLLSATAARDLGWASTGEIVARLDATLSTVEAMPKHAGHLYNWYDTRDLRVLDPAYVSSVDSGNLAGHLISVANACEEWAEAPLPDPRPGIRDTLRMAQRSLDALPAAQGPEVAAILDAIEAQLAAVQPFEALSPVLARLADKAARTVAALMPRGADNAPEPDLVFWTARLGRDADEHARDRTRPEPELADALLALAARARALALGMDFAFLLDPERKLLSIGWSAPTNTLDPSCYDLLASEARLASLFAIAKGDAPTKHWFRLGRTATPVGYGAALVSWSGSMFEYLMPPLVMHEPEGSLLAQTNRAVVERQRDYAASLGVPWGISEAAFNARDMELTYQYSNFGVPGLGLKRGLLDDVVVAPYATGLAAMIDPVAALRNYERLAGLDALGRYGFHEALDFTPARLPEGERVAVIRSFMAHHQGMTIAAIANVLHDGRLRDRFHREPMIRAAELLLQERSPRGSGDAPPRADAARATAARSDGEAETVRRHIGLPPVPPSVQLMSNGRYSVMVTAGGGGYSRWGDIALTRWREDATRDDAGLFVYLKDVDSGAVWSATPHPTGARADHQEAQFREDRAEFIRRDGSLSTTLDIVVSTEDDSEVRRVTLTNSGRRSRLIEVTSYAELVLTTPSTDNAHPAFAKMFVQTEHLPEFDALIATRRPRSPGEAPVWAAHFAVVEGMQVGIAEYETDRAQFLGRGRQAASPASIVGNASLSRTVGTVLDPVFALRRRVRIAPGKTARVAFWTLAAPSRETLVDLIDKHHDRAAFDRVRTLAWTQGQVQLRYLDMDAAEAADFQRLAAPLLYADERFRAPAAAILRGSGPQSALWSLSISGDLPIVLLRIDHLEDMDCVRQALRAQEYWRIRRLAVDLVIVNEHPSSYIQDLANAIDAAVRSSQSRPRFGRELAGGTVHVLRADLISPEQRALLSSLARVVLVARRGPIADQLSGLPPIRTVPQIAPARLPGSPDPIPPVPMLEFFNGTGGFDRDGTEYVTVLDDGATTPAPWINVVANDGFGFHASADGSGYVWAGNSRENQITAWSNDPVSDPPSEAFYIRDESTGVVWTPTAQPIRGPGRYTARHGFGTVCFEHAANGIAAELLHTVPLADPVRISRLRLTNRTDRPRRLSVTLYVEWTLGIGRGASAPHIVTEVDADTGAILARNPFSTAFPGRVAFADLGGGEPRAFTCDRTEFLGRAGMAAPAGLAPGARLSGAVGAGLDPCAALLRIVTLEPGESVEVVALLGQAADAEAATELLGRYRTADVDALLVGVGTHWKTALGAVQVRTPDRAMDVMLNGWLMYQAIACRVTARSAFYQASGAYGFRDQLQDGMALTFAMPEKTRAHLLRAAGRQFPEGDVQHWWLPHSGQGVRTRISDDRVWLAFAAATYVTAAGDPGVLNEMVPFLDGPLLAEGAHDAFFQPMQAAEDATLFEHCARGLDQAIAMSGPHGLPLMGTGDWNDGMNRVGEGGRGESVWLGWLLLRTIALFAPLADDRDPTRAARWRAHAVALRAAMEAHAWDGAWYRRATFDDGTWLGSTASDECRIDAIAQSWAVLSGAADPVRAVQAMASLDRHLIRPEDRLALLFTPPFDATAHDPGYIKGYPPGLRENGGQYSHAAMWSVMAFAEMGDGDAAHRLFAMLNPINHARDPEGAGRYKVEPYVVAADVYSVAPHVGRGGWTWYTGSAAWMHRAGVEGLLGIRREGDTLIVRPRLPAAWPGYEAVVTLGEVVLEIRVDAPCLAATLDGVAIPCEAGTVRVPLRPGRRVLRLGSAAASVAGVQAVMAGS